MEQRVNQMMRSRADSKECCVGLVGKPCQRVPIRRKKSRKGPLYILPGQATGYVRIVVDVVVVVKVNKLKFANLEVYEDAAENQNGRDKPFRVPAIDPLKEALRSNGWIDQLIDGAALRRRFADRLLGFLFLGSHPDCGCSGRV